MTDPTTQPRECLCGCGVELPLRVPGKPGRDRKFLTAWHGVKYRQRWSLYLTPLGPNT